MERKREVRRKIRKFFLQASGFVAASLIFLGVCGIESDADWRQILVLEGIGLVWLSLLWLANHETISADKENLKRRNHDVVRKLSRPSMRRV